MLKVKLLNSDNENIFTSKRIVCVPVVLFIAKFITSVRKASKKYNT